MSGKPRQIFAVFGALLAVSVMAPAPPDGDRDPQIGQSFRVPYRRTLTNHYLVRVRINGKGPFNFLVDTGAPALFVGTEAAKAAGLQPPPKDSETVWAPVDTLDIEGGIVLKDAKAHVFDVFQLKGMNALGLPGARIDGIMGFTILARFRMEFDPRSDRMTWTRLDYNPPDPYVPKRSDERKGPADVQAMEMIGPLMQFLSIIIGKQPEDVLQPEGLLGLELEEAGGQVRIVAVMPGTAAEHAGVRPGDTLLRVRDASIAKREAAHAAITGIKPGDEVELTLRRGSEELKLTVKAGEGL
jgi:hypothetical protein